MVQMRDIVDTSQDLVLCNFAMYLLSRELSESMVSIAVLLGSDATWVVCGAVFVVLICGCDRGSGCGVVVVISLLVWGDLVLEGDLDLCGCCNIGVVEVLDKVLIL